MSSNAMADPPPDIRRFREMVSEACRNDDVALMAEYVTQAPRVKWKANQDLIFWPGLRYSARNKSIRVLTYLLEQGGSPNILCGDLTMGIEGDLPTRELLDLLIAHGWDIDNGGANRSLVGCVLGDHELVEWCIAQGATLNFPEEPGHDLANGRRPILQLAACQSSVETFELLRSNGAHMSRYVVPDAVRTTRMYAPKTGESPSPIYTRRMDMVRHLVENVGADLNDWSWLQGLPFSSSLSAVACEHGGGDAKELIWYLLDRGADPYFSLPYGEWYEMNAIERAEGSRNPEFVRVVEEWQAAQRGKPATDSGSQADDVAGEELL